MHPLDDLLARACALHDPSEGLAGVRELREHLNRLEALHVENGLRGGWSWRTVADALGLSKQAAHRKYAALMRERLVERPPTAPVTPESRLAVALGRQEAEAMGCDAVGTEHVLLGLTRLDAEPVASVLGAAGVTPARARAAVASLNGDGETKAAQRRARLGPTPQCRAALEAAVRIAREGGAPRMGPEHLLGALTADPGCGAAKALTVLKARVP